MPSPNILFVFADQLSARWLEDERVCTPHLDEFASQCASFNQAYTNAPVCTPYRACLFTGKYPTETGVTRNGMELPNGVTTLADRLNDADYVTSYVGKWHLSGEPGANRWVPPEKRGGFQRFTGWESHHVDHLAGRIWRDDPDTAIDMPGHETDALTDMVCEELNALRPDKPFFMTVAYQAPHPPCTPPDEFAEAYAGVDLCNDLSCDRDAWYDRPGWNANYGVQEFRERYFGEISHLDAAFARVLEGLKRSGHADDTIVALTSDHGEMAGAHGLFGKSVMYDESVRVPLLIRMPGQMGVIVDTPVSTVDLHATLLALGGVDSSDCQGRDFSDALNGKEMDSEPVFIDLRERCVVDGHWKLVTDAGRPTMLFDLTHDPFELRDLVDSKQYSQEKDRLLKHLRDFETQLETES